MVSFRQDKRLKSFYNIKNKKTKQMEKLKFFSKKTVSVFGAVLLMFVVSFGYSWAAEITIDQFDVTYGKKTACGKDAVLYEGGTPNSLPLTVTWSASVSPSMPPGGSVTCGVWWPKVFIFLDNVVTLNPWGKKQFTTGMPMSGSASVDIDLSSVPNWVFGGIHFPPPWYNPIDLSGSNNSELTLVCRSSWTEGVILKFHKFGLLTKKVSISTSYTDIMPIQCGTAHLKPAESTPPSGGAACEGGFAWAATKVGVEWNWKCADVAEADYKSRETWHKVVDCFTGSTCVSDPKCSSAGSYCDVSGNAVTCTLIQPGCFKATTEICSAPSICASGGYCCTPDDSCALRTCRGQHCSSCGIDYAGQNACLNVSGWKEVAP